MDEGFGMQGGAWGGRLRRKEGQTARRREDEVVLFGRQAEEEEDGEEKSLRKSGSGDVSGEKDRDVCCMKDNDN